MADWNFETDVVVVGSGAGGMSAGLFASLADMESIVLEKTEQWGGTTAMSGGVVWIPANKQIAEVGIKDSEADGFKYIQKVAGHVSQSRLQAFIDAGPKMLQLLREQTHVRYAPMPEYMDYYPEFEGFKQGGRSMEPEPISIRSIGEHIDSVRKPANQGILNRFAVTAVEGQSIAKFKANAYLILVKRLLGYWLDVPQRLRSREDRRQTMGRALVIRLRKSLLEKNVPVWCNARVLKLLQSKNGNVRGVAIKLDGQLKTIKARRGVILASGGFAKNTKLRQNYQYKFVTGDWTAASDGDTGDAVALGARIGAAFEHMHCAWWTPTYIRPDGVAEALISGKSMPGSIFVNSDGRRFVNEAKPYEELTKIQLQVHAREGNCLPCFMIIDANYRQRYPVGPIGPAKAQPDSALEADLLNDNFLVKAGTLKELAGKLHINAVNLEQTVRRFNKFAVDGHDRDFLRGESLHDRYYADPRVTPNPSLAPLSKGPYYALRIYPGDLSTKGGLKCDENAQVFDNQGGLISGLYATGNCSGAVFGDSYPGAGATIASAMTFAYQAVEHIRKNS
ncbi:MAG: FAD-binding protein [Pseudomonadota bacterium]